MFDEYFVEQRSEPNEYNHNVTAYSNGRSRPQHEAQAFRDNSTTTRMITDTDDAELVDQESD